jgi:predicted TIM-barrel fold metal-dependent hydrolase
MGFPASDPIYDPFYEASIEADRPVLVLVGTTGSGAGLPGGGGVLLDLSHPRYIDALSVRHPRLRIIAGRNPWPWAEEMIAVMLHKPDVWLEFHGWSPKYIPDSLKHEISRRLKHKVMFGADYPLFTYERLVGDWEALGFDEATLRRLYRENAVALFPSLAAMA